MQKTVSRKSFIQNAFRLFKEELIDKQAKPSDKNDGYIYPPGIESVQSFLDLCKQSYDCISKCPHEALMVYREAERDDRFGYPVIKPRQSACYYCDDFPCIAACKNEALSAKFKKRKLGLAEINTNQCFAYNETFCQACIVNCPLTGEAIYANEFNQPVINEENCTGCGLCVQSCPAGESAITIRANKE